VQIANIKNYYDENALMNYLQYCENASLEIIKLLIELGSNVNQISNEGDTILHVAAKNRN